MEFIIDARVVKSEQWWTGALIGLRFDAVRNAAEEGGETFYLEYLASSRRRKMRRILSR